MVCALSNMISSNISNFLSRHFTGSDAASSLSKHQSLIEKLLTLIKLCASSKTLRQIHTQMLVHSIDKPNFLLSKLIDLKDSGYSFLLFGQMPQPNEYAFNVMIRGLATTWQRSEHVFQLYYKMKFLGLKPDNFTYPFLFIACGNHLALEHGRLAHCMVFRRGLESDAHVRHSLITMYSRCAEAEFARKVFDEILERDLVSWNSMISGYLKMGIPSAAIELFGKMWNEGLEPDEMTLVSILGACGDLGDLCLGQRVERHVVHRAMSLNSYIASALIGMYGKCGDLLSARRIFDGMTKKDLVTWNAMITGYARNGLSNDAISLFTSMKENGFNPDKITLIEVLSACASVGALDVGKSISAYASERGLQHDVYVATSLIDMYAKCGCIDHAYKVFENMPYKNDVSWNAMISAFAFNGRAKEALSLFECMLHGSDDACPNDITFVAVLSACVHAGLVDEGYCLFNLMESYIGLAPKIEHYTCMVDLLARAGRIYEAWIFIERMPLKPDGVILGSFLGACEKYKNVEIGERVIKLLLEIEPANSGNYVISSKIYANMKMWDDSARMIALMRHKGVPKIPGCSWIEINSQVHEFRVGDFLCTASKEIYWLLNLVYEELKFEDIFSDIDLS